MIPVLTEEDKRFIDLWREKQTIPCLAIALETYYELIDDYCKRHNLEGPYGRVAWFGQDKRVGQKNERLRERRPRLWSQDEEAFVRLYRPFQPVAYIAAALEKTEKSVHGWCKRRHLTGPREYTVSAYDKMVATMEVAEMAAEDRDWIVEWRPKRPIADLAETIGCSELAVWRVCGEAGVKGP